MIIWINGGFGAGKTTLAEELHRRLPDASLANFLGAHHDGPSCSAADAARATALALDNFE